MRKAALVLCLPVGLILSGCTTPAASSDADTSSLSATKAQARLLAADGMARGDATVTQATDGLHVMVKARGLAPGVHAVHIHTMGQCAAPDFASAGGHWNPTSRQHGKDNPAGKHMGDMPNMLAGADGVGEMEYVIAGGALTGGATPLLDSDGAAVVIHAQADDNRTDPAGNAGGRVACGVLMAG